jgi:O-antigen/teichoic acid export membrane protein
MARLLDPSDYGIIGMLAIFLAISQTFIDSGFSNALIHKQDRTEIDFSTVFYFNIVVGLFFYGLLFITAPFIAKFYHIPVLKNIARVIFINVLLNSFTVVQRAKLTILIDFKTQAKVSLLSVIVSGGVGIYLAYTGFGVWALVVQSVLGSGLNVILLWLFFHWKPLNIFSLSSFKQLFSFGSKLLASSLIYTLFVNITKILIGKFYQPVALGYYTRADSIAQFPSTNISGILQRVTYPILSSIQDNDERLMNIYRQYLRLTAFVIFPLMCGLAGVAHPFVLLVLSDKWKNIIPLLQIVCFSYMWSPIHIINLNVLQVKGRSDLFLRLEIIKAIINIITLIITIPRGIFVLCVGGLISTVICLLITMYYTEKVISIAVVKQILDLMPLCIISATMFLFVRFICGFFQNNLAGLAAGILAGIIYYIGIHIVIGSRELKMLCGLVRNKKSYPTY